METTLLTSTQYLQENPKFKEMIRSYNEISHSEMKKLHEENVALLLSLRISQREVEIHKNNAKKWREECEKLLVEKRSSVISSQSFDDKVEKVKKHQKAWAESFDYSSSDEEEE